MRKRDYPCEKQMKFRDSNGPAAEYETEEEILTEMETSLEIRSTWSNWCKIKEIRAGSTHTKILTSVAMPWGKDYLNVKRANDHDRILSVILTAIYLGLDVRFKTDGAGMAGRVSARK